MTGDLVTRVGDPVDVCLRHLARVKSGCRYDRLPRQSRNLRPKRKIMFSRRVLGLGIQFPAFGKKRMMEFRGHKLNFAGIDYQRRGEPYLVGAGGAWSSPVVTNILLSHNPDVFPIAAAQGYALTLAGHTHGGQITVEYLQQFVNPARFCNALRIGPLRGRRKESLRSRGAWVQSECRHASARLLNLSVIRLASA